MEVNVALKSMEVAEQYELETINHPAETVREAYKSDCR